MATATLAVNIDAADMANFEALCKDVGMSASTAVNVFVKAALRHRGIPFAVVQDAGAADPFYDKFNQEYILKSVAELRNGGGTVHELIEVADK